MPLLSDLRSSGGHYLYDLLNEPGLVSAPGAGDTAEATASDATVDVGTAAFPEPEGATATSEAAEGEALGFAVIEIEFPVNEGPGSIFYPSNFDGEPAEGDTVRYPTANGFTILPDGTIIAEEYGEYVCYYDDGDGEVEFTVVIDENAYVFADGATATATPSEDPDLYGGVNTSGTGGTVTATAPTGIANVGTIATGPGSTATATPAEGSVEGDVEIEAEGVEVTATPAEAVAELVEVASGDGVEVEATAAEATASGNVDAVGEGVTVFAGAPEGRAIGDRLPGSIPYAALTVVYPRNLLIVREQAA